MELTRKQVRIVLLMADGLLSEEIAREMGVQLSTIESHRKTILKNSPYRTWNQFMAEVGMSGQLKRWKELQAIRDGILNGYAHDTDTDDR